MLEILTGEALKYYKRENKRQKDQKRCINMK